jgi:hypothetical protein
MELLKVGLPLVGENVVEMVEVAGETDADRATAWLVPLSNVVVTVGVVLPPWTTEALAELMPIEKSNALAAGTALTALDASTRP